jgi:hypothetical protein
LGKNVIGTLPLHSSLHQSSPADAIVIGFFRRVFGKAVYDNSIAFVRVNGMPYARKLSADKSHPAGALSVFDALIKGDVDWITTTSCLVGEFKIKRK